MDERKVSIPQYLIQYDWGWGIRYGYIPVAAKEKASAIIRISEDRTLGVYVKSRDGRAGDVLDQSALSAFGIDAFPKLVVNASAQRATLAVEGTTTKRDSEA